jgi:hypothetical protein
MAGYLGLNPTPSPLTTSDLGDGIVTQVKINSAVQMGGPSLGSGDEYLRTNSNQIDQNITVPVGTNASSVGPVTVGTAYNVQVYGVYTII